MFCSECGTKAGESAKFCSACGNSLAGTLANPTEESNFERLEVKPFDTCDGFMDAVYPLVTPFVREIDADLVQQDLYAYFHGTLDANRTKSALIFVFENEILLIEGKGMLSLKPTEATLLKGEDINRIEVGTAHHTSHGGFVSSEYEYFTIKFVLNSGAEFLRYFSIALGDAGNGDREMFHAHMSQTAGLYPVYQSGEHRESSDGFTMSYGVGVWREV